MRLDSLDADIKKFGNLLVGLSLRDELDDFAFPWS
jgi:hypothetical protein